MSNTAKHILMGLALMGAFSAAQAADPALKVYDLDLNVNEQARTVDMVLELRMKDFKVKSNGEVIYTPVVISADGKEQVELEPFTVCGRSRYYLYMRDGKLDTGLARIYRSGSKELVKLEESVPMQDWMLNGATVEMRMETASCCEPAKVLRGPSEWGNLAIARINSTEPMLEFDYVFAPSVEEEPVKKSIEGKAFVTFVVNRTELKPDYMANPAEIKKITGSIDAVKADPDAIITEVHIRGYASPEGAYSNNERLAKGRTETLAAYVNSLYKFEPGIMTTSYQPEDWAGLRSYVVDSLDFNLTRRDALLAVIDGPLSLDDKDAALKAQFPADYQVILKEIYPWLRHSDYTVKYSIKVYSDLADLMRLYNSDPTKLRGVDFYTIAQQYPTGSEQYLNVMRKAVEVYPDDPMLNLNMANIFMLEGKLDAAQNCLLKSGRSPQANYARGILAAKRGAYAEAAEWFGLARDGGIEQAGTYARQINECLGADPVELLVPKAK